MQVLTLKEGAPNDTLSFHKDILLELVCTRRCRGCQEETCQFELRSFLRTELSTHA